jgi:hypothetical protein
MPSKKIRPAIRASSKNFNCAMSSILIFSDNQKFKLQTIREPYLMLKEHYTVFEITDLYLKEVFDKISLYLAVFLV